MKSLARFAARMLVVLALVAGGVAAAAAPAAAGDPNTCLSPRLCWYADTNYNGAQYYFTSFAVDTCYNIGSAWDNRISSLVNKSGRRVTMYTGANCGGLADSYVSGYGYPVVIFNDQYSSWKARLP